MSVVVNEVSNVMVNSEELIGTTEYLALYARCRISRYRYNRTCVYLLLLLASCENKIHNTRK